MSEQAYARHSGESRRAPQQRSWSTRCPQGTAESLDPGLTSHAAVKNRRDDGLFRVFLGRVQRAPGLQAPFMRPACLVVPVRPSSLSFFAKIGVESRRFIPGLATVAQRGPHAGFSLTRPNSCSSRHSNRQGRADQGDLSTFLAYRSPAMSVSVGVDVSKATLDVAIHGAAAMRRFPNAPAGHRQLIVWLRPLGSTADGAGGHWRL